jgi:E3 ubiquitin-protein ligase TRIP12
MSKPIYEGNKIVAKRHRENVRRIHKQKLQAARAFTDNKEPEVYALQHLKVNMKKEQMLEERYNEIDRHNQMLLHRMTEIIRHPPPHQMDRGPGPTTLNKDRRRRELVRITQENQSILRRIQEAQPVYNHLKWEESYRQAERYMQNVCEYPIVLGTPRRRPRRVAPIDTDALEVRTKDIDPQKEDGALSAREVGVAGYGTQGVFGVQFVHKETLPLSDRYYLVEIGTDGRAMTITAYDGDTNETLELLVSEKLHRRIYRECGGSYAQIARKLYLDNGKLAIKHSEAQPEAESVIAAALAQAPTALAPADSQVQSAEATVGLVAMDSGGVNVEVGVRGLTPQTGSLYTQ